METIDVSCIRKLLECKQLQTIFDRFYIVDLTSNCCVEAAIGDLTVATPQSYDNWQISFAEKMYKNDAAVFFEQMDLKKILFSLTEQTPRYIVYCRREESTCVQEYQLNISYLDERRTQLLIMREELMRNRPMSLYTLDELSHCNARFHFLVNRLAEDFIEVEVETGKCRMFHAANGMQAHDTLKEQIEWWAENFIVQEEREAYIKEFELENLMRSLRANNGYHSAAYSTVYGNAKKNLLIICTLIKENYGRSEEYIFAYAQDITPLKVQETRNEQLVDISQRLLTLSQTESVTGLLNRPACEKLMEEHLITMANAMPGTMLLIDIDHFKDFNDRYGHSTGDFVLKFMGKTMQDIFRSDDIVSRWGGDEFVVFMRDVYDKNAITSRIERLRVRLRQCKKEGSSLPITISIGGKIAAAGMSVKLLFEHCDKALYQVKSQGRDNYFIDSN